MYAARSEFVYSIPKAAPNELVLIGGASSASTILIRLAEEVRTRGLPDGGLNIRCFDKNGFANGGIAYGGCSDHHILNSVRSEMSPWRVDAFHEYCLEKGLGSCRDDFNRRKDYGAFLKSFVEDSLAYLSQSGVRFTHHPQNAYVQRAADGTFNIHNAEGGAVLLTDCAAGQIVLTVGYGPNNNFEKLRGEKGYIHSLYDSGAQNIAHIPNGANIAFIGRGPALYDFVNDLKGAGITNANLTILSRAANGPLSVRNVAIEADEASAVPDFITEGGFHTADDLRAKVIEAFKGAVSPRRLALDILRHLAPSLKKIDADEAHKFQSSHAMDSIRHAATPVPLQSHLTLSALNPSFVQARVNEGAITVTKQGFDIGLEDGRILQADFIVNGTGHGRHNAPILERLKSDGLARVNTALNILDTDETGYRLAGSGIGCIGPAINPGCDGVETFDIHAQSLVQEIWSSRNAQAFGHAAPFAGEALRLGA